MRRFSLLLSLIFLIPMGVSAYSVSCSGIPDASGCQQCFHFDLATNNAANDIFVPRSGIPTGQQEYIDLTKSTISGYTYQWASVSPVGNMTSSFDRFASGPNATASWVWAKTKSGQGITRGNIPTNIDYSKPVYSVKYTTVSHLKNQSTSAIMPGTEVTHLECGFFYAKAPTAPIICGDGKKESTEQCDDGNTNNNDGCSNACRLPVCGNNIREGAEECDDGNNRNGDACTSLCRNAGASSICGNGIREGAEECDDGNSSNTDTCSTVCRAIGGANPPAPIICGDGKRKVQNSVMMEIQIIMMVVQTHVVFLFVEIISAKELKNVMMETIVMVMPVQVSVVMQVLPLSVEMVSAKELKNVMMVTQATLIRVRQSVVL
jgi:cysteine-rich repeat protein